MSFAEVTIGSARLIRGDCREVLPGIGPVDAIVTDPPYHLAPMDKRHLGREIDKPGGYFRSLSTGFMNKAWDGGDIAFRPETWAAMLPALKPGGYLLAFGGTRTHHRLWCAIEDAGFVIQDTIAWLYGQGFPKNRTLLKPAMEPIVVAYKPGGPRTLQIDECRVASGGTHGSARSAGQGLGHKATKGNGIYNGVGGVIMPPHESGRWPANVCHDGSDEVLAAFAAFGEKSSGLRKSGSPRNPSQHGFNRTGLTVDYDSGGDSGTAARFFYCGKATKADRADSRHPTVKPIALMRWLVRLVTPPGGTVLDPFAGSGTTGAAALAEGRCAILIEREPEYFEDIKRRLRSDQRSIAASREQRVAA